MMNRQGRPTQAGEATQAAHDTFSGNHALAIEELCGHAIRLA